MPSGAPGRHRLRTLSGRPPSGPPGSPATPKPSPPRQLPTAPWRAARCPAPASGRPAPPGNRAAEALRGYFYAQAQPKTCAQVKCNRHEVKCNRYVVKCNRPFSGKFRPSATGNAAFSVRFARSESADCARKTPRAATLTLPRWGNSTRAGHKAPSTSANGLWEVAIRL
jgi:hypothetical protein